MTTYSLNNNFFIRRIEEITPAEAAAWDDLLLARGDLRRAFLSRTYVASVAHISGDVVVLVGYSKSAPCFFLPLQRRPGLSGIFGIFEPVGGVMTDYFGVIAADGARIVIDSLLKATDGFVNGVFFTHLDETQGQYGLHADETRTGLRTHLGNPPGEFWAKLRTTDKKLVYDTERREKKLVNECGSLTFEWTSSRPEGDLDWLIESKKSQYSRTGKALAPLFVEANANLLKALLKSSDECCSGHLSVLRYGERIVAAHFGLRCREWLHVWFPVYDKQFANYSPGRILFKHMFLAGAEHGVTVFDRGEGDNQAKRDFANDEHRFGRGFWQAPGVRGQLAHLALRFTWRFVR